VRARAPKSREGTGNTMRELMNAVARTMKQHEEAASGDGGGGKGEGIESSSQDGEEKYGQRGRR